LRLKIAVYHVVRVDAAHAFRNLSEQLEVLLAIWNFSALNYRLQCLLRTVLHLDE
jgi:hypothetical protein